ncbi:hypothetical protein C0J52_09527, partial [Blattella germanica]
SGDCVKSQRVNYLNKIRTWPRTVCFIASAVLEEMLEVIAERRALHRKHLHILMQEQTQNLNLSFGMGDAYHGLEFMKDRCKLIEDMLEEVKHVTHLRRHHLHVLLTPLLTNWSTHGIGDILVAFRLLKIRCKAHEPQYFDGTCSKLFETRQSQPSNDSHSGPGRIGQACPHLRDLNLASTPITDRGLVQLCVAEDGSRQCQQLIRLVVAETAVTCVGATVVLQSLPNLREFDYEKIFDRWDEGLESRLFMGAGVRCSAESTPPPSSLRLTTLISTVEHVSLKGLDAAARLCPETRTVTLANAWIPSEALYKLMLLDQLISISLTNSEGLTLDFHEGIGKSCPELRNLALSSIATYEHVGQLSSELFNQLRALELWSDPQADLSPFMIRQLLLFCPDMTNLLFKGCEIVSDKLMADIWKKILEIVLLHKFSTSRREKIYAPPILQQLLDAENELAVLRVWSCRNITKFLNIELIHRIKDENLDVYFEWFEYEE